ncbi:hypothetical protein NFI96_020424, partial [Prochilodus magdalenae]
YSLSDMYLYLTSPVFICTCVHMYLCLTCIHLYLCLTCIHLYLCLTCIHLYLCPTCIHLYLCLTCIHLYLCPTCIHLYLCLTCVHLYLCLTCIHLYLCLTCIHLYLCPTCIHLYLCPPVFICTCAPPVFICTCASPHLYSSVPVPHLYPSVPVPHLTCVHLYLCPTCDNTPPPGYLHEPRNILRPRAGAPAPEQERRPPSRSAGPRAGALPDVPPFSRFPPQSSVSSVFSARLPPLPGPVLVRRGAARAGFQEVVSQVTAVRVRSLPTKAVDHGIHTLLSMDSPPECVLAVSSEGPLSPPSMPSVDHSPHSALQSPPSAPSSPLSTPYAPLSPFALADVKQQDEEEEEEEDEELSAPSSPTPAVALFPGEEQLCSRSSESSPPATPSAPLPVFGALEQALSSGATATCSNELDLQLFNNEGVTVQGGPTTGPALRFPCHVCGKRFRFQSILSLHARAHSLDRDRRASALYKTLQVKPQQNHVSDGVGRNHNSREIHLSSVSRSLHQNRREEALPEEPLQTASSPQFLMDGATPLTPPLTEEAPASSTFSPLGPALTEEPAPSGTAPAFRCHACKGKFRTASELARHVRILHNPYKCTLCPFSANQEERLASHLQESHPPEEPVPPPVFPSRPITAPPQMPLPQAPALPAFRCETCGQRFTQSWFLKGHMRKHKDSLDHKCQVCGRGFKEPWFLKNHMKVHLNKLGLKAGLGNLGPSGSDQSKGHGNQALGALYSNLLLARSMAGAGGGRGSRSERSELSASSSKSSMWGYLGLSNDSSGASCMERLQAVAQVAEMGNGGERGGETLDGGEQAAMWQLVARSLAAVQHSQHQQQHQQPRSQAQHQRPSSQGTVAGEAEQVRAYLGGLGFKEDSETSGAPWECPECGKLFQSLQQVVAHARVHAQKQQRYPSARGAAGKDEDPAHRAVGPKGAAEGARGGGGQGSGNEGRQEAKQHQTGVGAVGSFQSVITHLSRENGLRAPSAGPSSAPRERVRGTGMKDCPYCGKAFRSSHHLKVHLRVHTGEVTPGERPYKCPHCDYAGTQSGSLKYHLQRHHRERNAMATSPSSSSPSLPSSLTGSPREGTPKQRRPSSTNQGSFGRAPAELPSSRHGQTLAPGPLEKKEGAQKSRASQKDRDLESQYRFLSGMMGELYPSGLEGGWRGETPPPKMPKVSRRKPLVTSRMVPANGHQSSMTPSASQECGFEPLDLSRRPVPGMGAAEQDLGPVSSSGTPPSGGAREGDDTLSQCVFCPFRTSSVELMAMHLQVNHTSKSRRKRGAPVPTDNHSPRLTLPGLNRDPLALWKFLSEGDGVMAMEDWIKYRSKTGNGVTLGDGVLERSANQVRDIPLTLGSIRSATQGLQLEEQENTDEEEGDEDEEEDGLEETSSPENYSHQQDMGKDAPASPDMMPGDLPAEEERLLGN